MGYAKRILHERILKNGQMSNVQSSVSFTYADLLKDAIRVNNLRRKEYSAAGRSQLTEEFCQKLDRMASLAQKKYHIDTEDFYNDLYNLAARNKRQTRRQKRAA